MPTPAATVVLPRCSPDARQTAENAARAEGTAVDGEVDAALPGLGAVHAGHHHVELNLIDAANSHGVDDVQHAGAEHGGSDAQDRVDVFGTRYVTGQDDAVAERNDIDRRGGDRALQDVPEQVDVGLHDHLVRFFAAVGIGQFEPAGALLLPPQNDIGGVGRVRFNEHDVRLLDEHDFRMGFLDFICSRTAPPTGTMTAPLRSMG